MTRSSQSPVTPLSISRGDADGERSHENSGGRLAPRLVSQREAAAYLGISYWTLRDLVFKREIPSLRIGRRLLLDLRDLEAFISQAKSMTG